jgi:uncharacterized protein with PQ loop repeat
MSSSGLLHISKRKRVYKKLEEYPSKKFWIRFLDKMLIMIAIIAPLMGIPQLWNVFINHDVAGLSFTTWSVWAFFNLFWLVYGFVHKVRPIIITYILWFLVNTSVAIGILLYS